MTKIDFTCPNCEEYYLIWDEETMPPMPLDKQNDIVEVIRKQYDEVGSCKKCVRKDPDIPTTLEMDGMHTREEMLDRFKLYGYCEHCKEWKFFDSRKGHQCATCGSNYSQHHGFQPTSKRTFNHEAMKKKKFK